MAQALIGLGSNIEPRRDYLSFALSELNKAPLKLLAQSQLYETEPMDVTEQASFLNMAALLETPLDALALLERLQAIETEAGKRVVIRRGPRTLDLDLWSCGSTVMTTERLELPHPRIAERAFALTPLNDIAPDWRHPLNQRTASEMLAALPRPLPKVTPMGFL